MTWKLCERMEIFLELSQTEGSKFHCCLTAGLPRSGASGEIVPCLSELCSGGHGITCCCGVGDQEKSWLSACALLNFSLLQCDSQQEPTLVAPGITFLLFSAYSNFTAEPKAKKWGFYSLCIPCSAIMFNANINYKSINKNFFKLL